MAPFPPIAPEAWADGIELARTNAADFCKRFFETYGKMPDVKGLTERFLLDLESCRAKMQVQYPPSYGEASFGFNYVWQFHYEGSHAPFIVETGERIRKKMVILQALLYQPDGAGGWVADFMHRQRHVFCDIRSYADDIENSPEGDCQIDLLKSFVHQARNNPQSHMVWVEAGYLLFSTVGVQYISIEHVLPRRMSVIWQGSKSDAEINAALSKLFYRPDAAAEKLDVHELYEAKE